MNAAFSLTDTLPAPAGASGLPAGRRGMVHLLLARYRDTHRLMLAADGAAVDFHQAMASSAGKTVPMRIYAGHEH